MRTPAFVSAGKLVAALGCASGLLACASVAAASTVSLATNPITGGSVALYEAAAGEVNQLFPYIGGDNVQFRDGSGVSSVVINPQTPCMSGLPGGPPPAEPNNFATCPKNDVDRIVATSTTKRTRSPG